MAETEAAAETRQATRQDGQRRPERGDAAGTEAPRPQGA